MNDLAKILGIYDAKVELKFINDHTISALFHFIFTLMKSLIYAHTVIYQLLMYMTIGCKKLKTFLFIINHVFYF